MFSKNDVNITVVMLLRVLARGLVESTNISEKPVASMFCVAAPQFLVFCTLPFGSLPAPVLLLPSTNHFHEFLQTHCLLCQPEDRVRGSSKPTTTKRTQHRNSENSNFDNEKMPLQKVVVSKVIFNPTRRIKE
jgi:hypothetical protein